MVVNGRRDVQKRLTGDRSGFRHGDWTALRDPSLRSGFRLRPRTPANRLNLLKKFAASTLGNFQSEYTTRKRACPVGEHEGEEGAWVGPVLSGSRLLFLFFWWLPASSDAAATVPSTPQTLLSLPALPSRPR